MKPFLAVVLAVLVYVGCHPRISDGPFDGRVLDARTGWPIEGAVVAAFWYRSTAAIAHDAMTAYAAQESVTDENGRFHLDGIHGWNFIPFSSIENANFIVFAPGYATCRHTGAAATDGCGLPDIKIPPLSVLGERERRRRDTAYPHTDFEHYVPQLMKALAAHHAG